MEKTRWSHEAEQWLKEIYDYEHGVRLDKWALLIRVDKGQIIRIFIGH